MIEELDYAQCDESEDGLCEYRYEPTTDKQRCLWCDNVAPREIEDSLSTGQARALLEYRGGCECPLGWPPCKACCDPITYDEAAELDLFKPRKLVDFMKHVRDLCK